jgi:hypothetical protein
MLLFDERRRAIRERLEKVMGGEWIIEPNGPWYNIVAVQPDGTRSVVARDVWKRDVDFLAHARDDIELLLNENEFMIGILEAKDVDDVRSVIYEAAKIARQDMLRNREFRRHIRKYISSDLWQQICDDWAKMHNKKKQNQKVGKDDVDGRDRT